jgi:hypothetical protein
MARATTLLASLALGTLALAAPAAAGDLYPFDLKAKAPRLHRALSAALPAERSAADWLPGLDGTSGPLREVEVAGRPYLTGYVCRPHDCRANRLVFLLRPDGGRAATLLRTTPDGKPARVRPGGRTDSPEEAEFLRQRLDD